MKVLKLWRARQAVILAAKGVESSYVEGLAEEYDPDDLHDLRLAVRRLRDLESGEAD